MSIGRVLIAGAAAGLLGALASALITGRLFHRFQALTPQTWRAGEGPKQYALASGLTLLCALLVATLFNAAGWAFSVSESWCLNAALFGVLCWAALVAPVLLSMALFANVNRYFVLGLLLDWLVVATLASVAMAWALRF